MKFKEMFEKQKELDNYILSNMDHSETKESLYTKNILALIVELAEVANATRCFKYWSKKGSMERSIVLEELADCLHFILSLGNKIGSGITEIDYKEISQSYDVNTQMIYIITRISHMQMVKDLDEYKDLFSNFLGLVILLGFTGKELEMAYYKKLDINYKRQEEGY